MKNSKICKKKLVWVCIVFFEEIWNFYLFLDLLYEKEKLGFDRLKFAPAIRSKWI